MTSDFREMATAVHKTAVEHGWWEEDRQLPEALALMHSELSEALEEYRDGNGNIYENPANPGKPEGIIVELADCIIRIMDWCEHEAPGLLTTAMQVKMHYNEGRPYRHGGKLA